MASVRFIIAMTWLCFGWVGLSFLFRFSNPLLIALLALIISTIRRFPNSQFPRAPKWFDRIVYVLLFPAVFFYCLGLWCGFAEPWQKYARIGLIILLPPLVVFAAYEDLKAWKAERCASGHD